MITNGTDVANPDNQRLCEKAIIEKLHELNELFKQCDSNRLWLWSACGRLHLMFTDDDGEPYVLDDGDGETYPNPDSMIETLTDIPTNLV